MTTRRHPARQTTTADTSLILRILWAGWEAGRGRPPTYDEIQKLRVPMLNTAKRYLADVDRLRKPPRRQAAGGEEVRDG